jgi:hypothetical protein
MLKVRPTARIATTTSTTVFFMAFDPPCQIARPAPLFSTPVLRAFLPGTLSVPAERASVRVSNPPHNLLSPLRQRPMK